MNIYIDFDDCLCETAKYFSGLVYDLFGKNTPYEEIRYFDLQKSFSLSDSEFEKLMIEGHRDQVLLSYEETPHAIETVNSWLDNGHDISIITGRPYSAYESSRKWLDDHGLTCVRLYCLNKYGRDSFIKSSDFSLEIEDYYKMNFDLAVEDSPLAFHFFDHLPDLKVMVYDRPWNRDCTFPGDNYHRCLTWPEIRSLV